MLSLPGYTILSTLYDGEKNVVFRSRREIDDFPVVIKLSKAEFLDEMGVARIKLEYQILNQIESDKVVKAYAVETYKNMIYLVLEDCAGLSLAEWIKGRSIPPEEFVRLAVKVTEGLEQIHQNGIIHRNINPFNMVYNPETKDIKIIGFGAACRTPADTVRRDDQENPPAYLAYVSPEQTGRLNRVTGHRTDLYSLGVTFYEMLAGRLPFAGEDALELIHSHIALNPQPLHLLNSAIPQTLSEIVAKLMAKDPDDRYNSATGLKRDLLRCLRESTEGTRIEGFPLGIEDYRDELRIPQQLYGRSKELRVLESAFERVAGGRAEMLMVYGYSGAGKTSLVRELRKTVEEKNGIFIEGKFDQYQKSTPYFACIKAYTGLIDKILTEDPETLAGWKENFQKALGANGKVLTDVLPNLELVIGPQPGVPKLDALEAQNRFNYVFRRFVAAIARKEHPLVVFIDDLQWVDSASLYLWKALMTGGDLRHFFFIGAYRNNEVDNTHPLSLLMKNLQKDNVPVSTLAVPNLPIEAVNALIADALQADRPAMQDFSSLVYAKTQGNAFFVIHFLRSLTEKGLLRFGQGRWLWDIEKIKQEDLADNVVELTASRIRKLPEAVQEVLKLAASIGNRFEWDILSIAAQKPVEELAVLFRRPLAEGLAVLEPTGAKFAHDRIQQAAYSLLDEQEKKLVHLRVGRLLLQHIPAGKQEERLFDIVNQWNYAIDILTDPAEKIRLAGLNLAAGRRARAAAAYKSSCNYLLVGVALLSNDAWRMSYDLALALYTEAAQAAYLSGDFPVAEQLAGEVLASARTVMDKIAVQKVRCQLCWAQKRQLDGISILLPVLRELGITFPENPTPADVQASLVETGTRLAGRQIEDLVDLPPMTDPQKIAAMELLAIIRPLATQVFPALYPLVNLAMVDLSMEYGNTTLSAYGYTGYALLLGSAAGDIETSYRFGTLAMNLLSRLNAGQVEAKVLVMVNGYVRHYKEHVRETLQPFVEGCRIGMENGDLSFAALNAYWWCSHSFFAGLNLRDLERKAAAFSDLIRNIRQEATLGYNEIFRQVFLNLLGHSDDPLRLKGEAFDEDTMFGALEQTRDSFGLFHYYFAKALCNYLFHDYRQAKDCIRLAEPHLAGVPAMLLVPLYHFYDSLILLARYPGGDRRAKGTTLNRVEANQEKMRLWARHAPMNYRHKYCLVEAEKNRVLGRKNRAADFYDQAVTLARENGYLNEEALAFELAGRFYLAAGQTELARYHTQQAHYCYMRWGAQAKARRLEEDYPLLLTRPAGGNAAVPGSGATTSETLDFATVMKAAQIISSEMDIAALLKKTMHVILENAGAEKGYFILQRDGRFFVEAEGLADSRNVQVLRSTPVENAEVSVAIINYVARTRENVVLDDAAREGKFTDTTYVREKQPKSILCLALVNQGRLVGLIYLENNAVRGAFTDHRLRVLELLAGQMAISISNATLYMKLGTSEATYRTIFENSGTSLLFIEEDTTISLVNKEFEKLVGYTKAEVEGKKKWTEFVGEEDLARMREFHHLRRLDPEAAPQTYQCTLTDRHGRLRHVAVSVAVLPGTAQSLASLLDITQRTRAEKELERAHHHLVTTLDSISDGFVMIDRNWRMVYLNPELERILGMRREDLLNQSFWATFSCVIGGDWERPIRQVMENRTAVEIEYHHVSGGRCERWFDRWYIYRAYPSGDGGMSVFVRDITGRKRAEEALRKAHDELEIQVEVRTKELVAANEELSAVNEELSTALEELKRTQSYLVQSEKMAALGTLVAGMAHEINTPVGVAVTAASFLKQITSGLASRLENGLKRSDLLQYIADAEEAAGIVLTNLERSAALVRSFKQVSVDQSSETRRVFNLKQYLYEILLSLRPKLKKTRHNVTVNCDDRLEIDAFPGALSQIITNLVINSLTHAYAPDDAGSIVIEAGRSGEDLVLTYADDGKGMEARVLTKIFEPFFTTRRGAGSTGLGLHVLYNIVTQQFGGNVECRSEPGRGTVFIMTFPLRAEGPSGGDGQAAPP